MTIITGGGVSGPIGILGGIFDPVHNGHLAIASLARDYFSLSTVLFIPAGVPPHKITTVSASPANRLEMLRMSLEGVSYAQIWDKEVSRTGISYTVDTLELLINRFPGRKLYFLVGADNLREIQTWHRYRDILSLVTLCVTERPGYPIEIPAILAGAKVKTFPSPFWGISSSLLRDYLQKGYSCRHLLPEPVLSYIREKKLYTRSTDRRQ